MLLCLIVSVSNLKHICRKLQSSIWLWTCSKFLRVLANTSVCTIILPITKYAPLHDENQTFYHLTAQRSSTDISKPQQTYTASIPDIQWKRWRSSALIFQPIHIVSLTQSTPVQYHLLYDWLVGMLK